MLLLSSFIVDQGWEQNSEDRVTYRGIDVPVMNSAREGKTYRLITISESYIKLEFKIYFEKHIFLNKIVFLLFDNLQFLSPQ